MQPRAVVSRRSLVDAMVRRATNEGGIGALHSIGDTQSESQTCEQVHTRCASPSGGATASIATVLSTIGNCSRIMRECAKCSRRLFGMTIPRVLWAFPLHNSSPLSCTCVASLAAALGACIAASPSCAVPRRTSAPPDTAKDL
eukprot:6710331-Prymnesium_polylepis.1